MLKERLLQRFPAHYILVMMCVTRLFAFVGGALVVFYVNITFNMALYDQHHFEITAIGIVSSAVLITMLMALWETRDLRQVLVALKEGKPVDLALAVSAGRQAVLFPGQHAWYETIVDPLVTVLPLCVALHLADGAPMLVMLQVTLAGFMGISASIMTTFFVSEHWLRPVIRHLLTEGIPIAYTQLPESRIRARMTICFGLTIAVTGLMIGALASSFWLLMVAKRTRCDVIGSVSISFSVHSSRGSLLLAVRIAILPGLLLELVLNS